MAAGHKDAGTGSGTEMPSGLDVTGTLAKRPRSFNCVHWVGSEGYA